MTRYDEDEDNDPCEADVALMDEEPGDVEEVADFDPYAQQGDEIE